MTAESVSYLLGQQEVGLRQHSKWTLWTGHNGFHWYNHIIFPRFLYRLWLPSHSVSLFVVTLLSPRWMCRPPFKNSTSEPILDSCHLKWWKIFEFYFGYGVMRVKPFLKIDKWYQDFVRFWLHPFAEAVRDWSTKVWRSFLTDGIDNSCPWGTQVRWWWWWWW